jgi:hypothetical protein
MRSREAPRSCHRRLLQQNRPIADIPLAATNIGFGGKTDIAIKDRKCPLMTQSGHQVWHSLQRRCPSLIPNALAFWRNPPTVRFISLEIFLTCSLSFEYRLSSATCALVQATRFVRRRFAFLAIDLSMSFKIGSINKAPNAIGEATILRL